MASRNRTQFFREARERFHRRAGRGKRVSFGDHELGNVGGAPALGTNLGEARSSGHMRLIDEEMGPTHPESLPPWLEAVDKIKYEISRVEKEMLSLSKLHEQHILPDFFDRTEEEHEIDIKTREITRMIHQLQAKIKSISKMSNLGKENSQIQQNIQNKLAGQLHDLSMKFRASQQNYLQRLKELEMKSHDSFFEDSSIDFVDPGMTDYQLDVLQSSEAVAQNRETELRHIAQSVTELADIVKDIAMLVVDQGTILDRIDYNIEMTEAATDRAVEQLRKADEQGKKARTKMCIFLLCVVIMALSVIVVLKLFVKMLLF